MGRLDEALTHYRQARARIPPHEVEASELSCWAARVGYRIGRVQMQQGLLDEPRAEIEKGIEHAEAAGLCEESAELWAVLAALHRRKQDLASAYTAALAGLHVCRRTGDRGAAWRQAVSKLMVILGGVAHSAGRLVRAERFHLWACRVIGEHDNPDQLSRALNNLAGARFARGDLNGASESFQRALKLSERSGDLPMRTICLTNLGEVELLLGNPSVARGYLNEAVKLGTRTGAAGDLTECHRNLAAACLALGDGDAAISEAARALELAQVGGARRLYLPNVLHTLVAVVEGLDEVSVRTRATLEEIERALDGMDAAERARPELAERIAEAVAALRRRRAQPDA
jgi:tetratricopeptide (TPR) repeat protein